MPKFLLDANLSPETAEFLRRAFDYDAVSLIEERKAGLTDREVIALAKSEKRIIITLDLDFGELYHEISKPAQFGAIILRLADQRVESVNATLKRFFSSAGNDLFKKHPRALVVLDESSFRVKK